MSPHEAKVRQRYPDAYAERNPLWGMPGAVKWLILRGRISLGSLGQGGTEAAAWTNALRAIDPDDRTPLPRQAEFDLDAD